MSVYLDGTSVLLNDGKVATDAACCCGCPETITITFTGVTFSCGCFPHDGISSTFEDTCPDHGGAFSFNGTPLELFLASPCEGIDCWWAGGNLCFVEAVYATADCSGPVDNYVTADVVVVVARVGSTWYVLAELGGVVFVLFEGSGTDPSSIANSAPCTIPSTISWDSPLIECAFGGPQNAYGIATGGTATITL